MKRLITRAVLSVGCVGVMAFSAFAPSPVASREPASAEPLVLAPAAPNPVTPVTVSKSVSQVVGVISDTLIYTITVHNPSAQTWFYQGPYDPLPPQVSFVAASAGYTYTPTLLRWNIPPGLKPIAPGATDVYTAAAHIDVCGQLISNIANIRVAESDLMGNPELLASNAAVTEVPCVQPQPAFIVTKYVNTTTARISDTVRYRIVVTNVGAATGTFTGPIDVLPTANATLLSATPGYTGPNPIQWNTGGLSLGPGASAVYTIAMHVDGPCGAIFENRASIIVPTGLVASYLVSTTVACDGGWKWSPPFVLTAEPITFIVHIKNPHGSPMLAGWTDPGMRTHPAPHVFDVKSLFVITPTPADGPPAWNPAPFDTHVLSGNFSTPQLSGQFDDCSRVVNIPGGGAHWDGVLQPGETFTCGFAALIPAYARCGDWVNNTVVFTSVIPGTNIVTTTYGTSSSRVMCPDLGDAPDSVNHFGAAMRVHPFGAPSPVANYPSVHSPKPPASTGPIHWLAGSSSAPNGPPARAIDSALGLMTQPQTTTLTSIVSNERDADLVPDQDPLALKRNIRPNPNPALGRSNRDRFDNAFTAASGAPLNVAMFPCSTTFVQYALFINPASPYAGPRYINLWADWNRDGDWADTFTTNCPNMPAPVTTSEWVVQNAIAPAASGIYVLPPVMIGPVPVNTPMWVRISVADAPAPAGSVGNGPVTGYLYGETEDHFMCYKPKNGPFGGTWGPCLNVMLPVADPIGVITLTHRLSLTVKADAEPLGTAFPITFAWQISGATGVNLAGVPPRALAAAVRGGPAASAAADSGVIEPVDGYASTIEMGGATPGTYELLLHVTSGDGEDVSDVFTVVVNPLRPVFLPATRRLSAADW